MKIYKATTENLVRFDTLSIKDLFRHPKRDTTCIVIRVPCLNDECNVFDLEQGHMLRLFDHTMVQPLYGFIQLTLTP